jgi:hypothetical protein
VATRQLIAPFLGNTLFCRGALVFSFVRSVPIHTIFSRRDRGNVPYLLTELGSDLRAGKVDRQTIDQQTEGAIRSLAGVLANLPPLPLPVIVEDVSAQHYLILEGNRRFSAVAFVDPAALPAPCQALIGRSPTTWPQMLANFKMVPPP